MHPEIKFMFLLLFLLPMFLVSTFAPTSWFFSVKESKVTADGLVTLKRSPIYNNMVLRHAEEVITKDGRSCVNVSGSAIYEKTESNTVRYMLDPSLMPCVEKGAVHKAARQYLHFKPLITETVIE